MKESRTGAAILAAGASRRLGRPKQLVTLHDAPLVRVVAREVVAADFTARALVVGHEAARVRDAVSDLAIEVLENASFAEGIASSVRAAAKWAITNAFDALVLVLADQPLLRASHLERLLAAHADGASLVASRYAKNPAVPALFSRVHFEALASLEGDRGAASLLRDATDVVLVDWPEGAFDVDEERDVKAVRDAFATRSP